MQSPPIKGIGVSARVVKGRLVGHGGLECKTMAQNVQYARPMIKPTNGMVRVAALSDIHYSKTSAGSMAPLFSEIAEAADVLLLGGDLTDYGAAEEARILAKDLAQVKIPVVAVLGNH